jgi:hypothetical protein
MSEPGRRATGWRATLGLGLAMVVLEASCGPPPAASSLPRDLDAEAKGAADTFLRCYERDGAECRHTDAPFRAWHALRTLIAVRDHSPLALVEEVPRSLDDLRDDAAGRKAFIAQLAQRESEVRVGRCAATAVRTVGSAIEALRQAARSRLEELGLGDTAAGGRLGEVSEATAGLREAREVRVTCAGGRELHLVLVPTPEGAWHPVQLGETPVAVGVVPVAETTPVAVTVADTESIDPWLPFGEDQL